MASPYPTPGQIRDALLERANAYARIHHVSLTRLGRECLRDPAFFRRLAQGRNFTFSNYERAMTWLDQHWPETAPKHECLVGHFRFALEPIEIELPISLSTAVRAVAAQSGLAPTTLIIDILRDAFAPIQKSIAGNGHE